MDRTNRSMQVRDSFSADRNGIAVEMTARKRCDFLLYFSARRAYPMWSIQHPGLWSLSRSKATSPGYKVAAIGRGPESALLAKKIGASVYIDSQSTNAVEALQKLGAVRRLRPESLMTNV